ncbi:MAG: ribosome maturation factor RimM [Anaerolineales bacterium]|nr:ribosome maturation factor RimM [Anaerolineales bacterium]
MPELVTIGRIVRPHGVRGEMVLEADADVANTLAGVETVYVGEPPVACTLVTVRRHRGRLLIRLAGCDDRNFAETYRGQSVRLARAARPLPPGTYYWSQILGLTVVTVEGETLGAITEILETGANDVYVVNGDSGEVLIPAAPGVVQQVDLERQRMIVQLPEGLR